MRVERLNQLVMMHITVHVCQYRLTSKVHSHSEMKANLIRNSEGLSNNVFMIFKRYGFTSTGYEP